MTTPVTSNALGVNVFRLTLGDPGHQGLSAGLDRLQETTKSDEEQFQPGGRALPSTGSHPVLVDVRVTTRLSLHPLGQQVG